MKSEATALIEELEAFLADADSTETYVSRGTGKTYKANPDKGDGYWCPDHEGGCYRRCDSRRWGKFGAAGVLFFHRATGTFLLNQRSRAIHHGGSWSTLGGAIDRNETPYAGALREAAEEIGDLPETLTKRIEITATTEGKHSDWTYTTFVVEVEDRWTPEGGDWESIGNEWVTLSEIAVLRLHPGFKANFHTILAEMYRQGLFR